MKLMEVLKVVLVVAMVMVMVAEAIWLELLNSETKCVYEDIRNNVVVLGEYIVIHADEEHTQANFIPTISVRVTSPFGNSLHHEENATYGRFAFTTSEHGNYLACFRMNNHVPGNKNVAISLQWKIGIDARDWDSIARKEKIEGVELELMKLKGLGKAVHENLLYLKKREEEMRGVSERTNGAVAWFSMMSLSICIMAAAVQIWYLKSYFRKKRLI
ncbi:transmembrane emp24 domain-containing protein p24delta3-like [Solanum stenotomum]|uniref:transmembrane emp24 domain-containing protein p24delta3-like n=1 Tax=Solanum stenotomum TaxID=172797 RepID=UPI0020D1789E|nr:transmembrane emp24 domain-containing protein p24delta3-like [Solanum stenotomum]